MDERNIPFDIFLFYSRENIILFEGNESTRDGCKRGVSIQRTRDLSSCHEDRKLERRADLHKEKGEKKPMTYQTSPPPPILLRERLFLNPCS